jgi:hypothetical protein
MEPTPVGVVSQTRFESMVRRLFEHLSEGWWTLHPGSTAIRIAHVLAILDHQPDLLEGKRLNHNLGEEKMAWLRDTYQLYREDRIVNASDFPTAP